MGSWNRSTYSFSYKPGSTDFYGNDPDYPKIIASGEGSVTVVAVKASLASASLSAQSSVTAVAREILLIQPDLDGDAGTVTVATEVLKGIVFIDGESSATVTSLKFAKAASGIAVTSSADVVGTEVLLGSSAISVSSNLTVVGRRGQLIDSALSGSVTTTIDALKIPAIALSTSGSLTVNSTALEILLASTAITTCDVDLSAVSLKFALGSSSIVISSNVSAVALKFAKGSSSTSGSGDLSATALEILLAGAALDQTVFVTTIGREILGAASSINISTRVLWAGATAFNASRTGEDVRTPRTLVVIDNMPLSEHNRKMTTNVVRSFVENVNWESSKSRYYKNANGRRTFDISWSYLPGERDDTADLRFGRNKIQSIAADPDVHTVKILNFDTDGETPYSEDSYTVMVTGYSENLIRRDVSNGVYLWDCQLQLEEV